jgi:hypothetical protein
MVMASGNMPPPKLLSMQLMPVSMLLFKVNPHQEY